MGHEKRMTIVVLVLSITSLMSTRSDTYEDILAGSGGKIEEEQHLPEGLRGFEETDTPRPQSPPAPA